MKVPRNLKWCREITVSALCGIHFRLLLLQLADKYPQLRMEIADGMRAIDNAHRQVYDVRKLTQTHNDALGEIPNSVTTTLEEHPNA
jgi:hypothetical protein